LEDKNLLTQEAVAHNMEDTYLLSEILEKNLKSEFPNPREIPEIFLFTNYLRSLEKEKIIDFSQLSIKKKKSLFIPASNGGSIAALAILFSLASGIKTIVREPRRGFGVEMNILLDVFKKVELFKERLVIVDSNQFKNIINNEKFSFLLAWGANKTRLDIEEIAKETFAKLYFFGSQVSLSIIDIDEMKSLNESKRRRIIDSYIADTLTFDQSGCTNSKLSIFIAKKNSSIKNFINNVNIFAEKSRHAETLSIQEKSGYLIKSYGLSNPDFMKKNFSLSDRIWFIKLEKTYADLFDDLDQIRSGVVIYKVTDNTLSAIRMLDKLPNFGRITFYSSEVSDLIKDLKFDKKLKDKLLNIGFSNSLNFVWDGVDLSSIFK